MLKAWTPCRPQALVANLNNICYKYPASATIRPLLPTQISKAYSGDGEQSAWAWRPRKCTTRSPLLVLDGGPVNHRAPGGVLIEAMLLFLCRLDPADADAIAVPSSGSSSVPHSDTVAHAGAKCVLAACNISPTAGSSAAGAVSRPGVGGSARRVPHCSRHNEPYQFVWSSGHHLLCTCGCRLV